MKKKIYFLLIALSVMIGQANAQLDSFNLRNYKLPELKRNALELSFDFSGSNNFYNLPDSYYYGDKQASNQYQGNLFVNYSSYLNKPKIQREVNTGFDFTTNYSNAKIDKRLMKDYFEISPSVYGSVINRLYFKEKIFIETDFSLSFSYQKISDVQPSDYKNKLQFNNNVIYLPVKIGCGRIDEVQDARQAIYLFDELAKQKRVTENVSSDDVLALAKFISELKNKRFFDNRLQKIYEIEAVDSFMNANNFILNKDVRYFTTLMDYWNYGNLPVRNSGTRFSFCVYPGYFNYNLNQKVTELYYYEFESKSRLNLFMISGGFEFLHERPINLHWQNTIEINGYAGTVAGNSKNKILSTDYKVNIPNLQIGYRQKIGFYPNTRTYLEYSFGVNYGQLYGKTDYVNDKIGIKGQGAKAFSNLSVYYYISPRLRLSLYSSLYYIWQDSDDEAIIDFDYPADYKFPIAIDTYAPAYYYPTLAFSEKEFHHNFEFKLTYTFF